jgi:hypothetical protein
MKSLRALAAVTVCGLLASGCVVVPVTIESYDPECRVVTHHMELVTVQVAAMNHCGGGQGCEAFVLVGLGVTAATAIVSGSIVVIGNVAYWAEHRAACPVLPAAPTASAVI